MKIRYILLNILTFCWFISGSAQSGFNFYGINKDKQQISFKLKNNLIVIPIEINGKKLSFILDTGVNKTILFNLSDNDSIGLKNVEKVKLQGLGQGESVSALISKKNTFRIKQLISSNEDVYVILKDKFKVSSRMGTTIHGIIGYNLLRDVIVKINYNNKKITFYNPDTFKYSKCRKCETFPLDFFRNKPYIDAVVQMDTVGNKKTKVKMLIDSGGSDALWLLENTKKDIKTPKLFFNDILGEGLSGTIYGKRSRIPEFRLGKFKFKNPTVSFLDSVSSSNARKFKERNGSIGNNILKRFRTWIDYPNKKITFKKTSSFNGGFNYNMSGINVIYNGVELVKEKETKKVIDSFGNIQEDATSFSFVSSFKYKFKPSYIIDRIVEDSPAFLAGIKVNDVIFSINGKRSHEYKLENIMEVFQSKPNKKIRISVIRNSKKLSFEFRLQKKI